MGQFSIPEQLAYEFMYRSEDFDRRVCLNPHNGQTNFRNGESVPCTNEQRRIIMWNDKRLREEYRRALPDSDKYREFVEYTRYLSKRRVDFKVLEKMCKKYAHFENTKTILSTSQQLTNPKGKTQ